MFYQRMSSKGISLSWYASHQISSQDCLAGLGQRKIGRTSQKAKRKETQKHSRKEEEDRGSGFVTYITDL